MPARKPLYALTDAELRAVSEGRRDAEYGADATRARQTARTILVNRAVHARAAREGRRC